MFIEFVGYLVDLKINCDTHKLTRSFQVIYKKNNKISFNA